MANWFKIYETDLDETRLKYALNKIPEVGWVWIGILSECCKHRSDTIRWSTNSIDLFGFSDRLKVSIPKVNEAINLLCEIDYIKVSSEFIKVLKWNEKQSEYCVRKNRGDYENKPKKRIVSDNIGDSPLEERRGEENRVEEKRREGDAKKPETGRGSFPSLKEVEEECGLRCYPRESGEFFWNHFEASGWVDKNNIPIAKWRPKLATWVTNERAKKFETSPNANAPQKEHPDTARLRAKHKAAQ